MEIRQFCTVCGDSDATGWVTFFKRCCDAHCEFMTSVVCNFCYRRLHPESLGDNDG